MNEIKEPPQPKTWHDLYIELCADPFDHRTDKEFYESIGLEKSTFCAWKAKYRPYIFREVEARRKNYINEYRSKGHKALAKKLDKDTNAIKLLFQLLGDLVEKTESRVEMSHDDKIRRLNALLHTTGKRQEAWNAITPGGETIVDSTDIPAEQVGPLRPQAS